MANGLIIIAGAQELLMQTVRLVVKSAVRYEVWYYHEEGYFLFD